MLPPIAPTPADSRTAAAWPNVMLQSSSIAGTMNAIRKKSNRSSTAPTITAPARIQKRGVSGASSSARSIGVGWAIATGR
jgi:hypothetical protein